MNNKVLTKKVYKNMLSLVASIALALTTLNVSTACWYIMHQDEIPEEAKRLRKF
ncbi:MAG: cyclic lactone autoinducer peptide [Lachnotalea sp.]